MQQMFVMRTMLKRWKNLIATIKNYTVMLSKIRHVILLLHFLVKNKKGSGHFWGPWRVFWIKLSFILPLQFEIYSLILLLAFFVWVHNIKRSKNDINGESLVGKQFRQKRKKIVVVSKNPQATKKFSAIKSKESFTERNSGCWFCSKDSLPVQTEKAEQRK